MAGVKIGHAHKLRKNLFVKGLREGYLDVAEVERTLPEGLMSASERWLFYFSLRASQVELRDSAGRPVTPDDVVPEGRRRRGGRQRGADQAPHAPNDSYASGSESGLDLGLHEPESS